MAERTIEELTAEIDRWKSVAQANDRSYCVAREALEMTRKWLAEMTSYRDNARERLEREADKVDKLEFRVRHLKADLAREKRARRDLARKKKGTRAT